ISAILEYSSVRPGPSTHQSPTGTVVTFGNCHRKGNLTDFRPCSTELTDKPPPPNCSKGGTAMTFNPEIDPTGMGAINSCPSMTMRTCSLSTKIVALVRNFVNSDIHTANGRINAAQNHGCRQNTDAL